MAVQTFDAGGKRYAIGLTWAVWRRRPSIASIRRAARASHAPRRAYRYAVERTDNRDRYLFGSGEFFGAARDRVFSGAATMARGADDGIYVADVGNGYQWLCVVQDHAVRPGTDVIALATEIAGQVNAFRSALSDTPVFASEGVSLDVPTETFDPIAKLAGITHPVVLQRIRSYTAVAAVSVFVAVVAVAVIGYSAHARKLRSQRQNLSMQKQRATAKHAYLMTVRGILHRYPKDPAWARDAWSSVRAYAPPYLAGWSLKQVSCTLSGCNAEYIRNGNAVYALTPFLRRFGKRRVDVSKNAKSLKVSFPKGYAHATNASLYLHRPLPPGMPLMDWQGQLRLHVPGVRSAPTVLVQDLGAEHHARKLQMRDVASVSVGLSGEGDLDAALYGARHWGARSHLRITRFTYKPDLSDTGLPRWKLALVGLRSVDVDAH